MNPHPIRPERTPSREPLAGSSLELGPEPGPSGCLTSLSYGVVLRIGIEESRAFLIESILDAAVRLPLRGFMGEQSGWGYAYQ